MSTVRFPRLAEVLLATVAEIIDLLEPEDNRLAQTIADSTFYGRCPCTPTCPLLLTAPPGSSSGGVVILESDGEPVISLHIDPTGRTHRVTGIEVLDGRDLVRPS